MYIVPYFEILKPFLPKQKAIPVKIRFCQCSDKKVM